MATLLGAADIADMVGVNLPVVTNWHKRGDNWPRWLETTGPGGKMPQPITRISRNSVPVWDAAVIVQWMGGRNGNL